MTRAKCPECKKLVELDKDGCFSAHVGGLGLYCRGSHAKRIVKGFMDGYKTYEGPRGSAEQWNSCFQARMGFEEAEAIIHGQDDTPRGILGVGPKATWDDIRKAYRLKAMACHPDLCGQHGLDPETATASFKKLQAAFTVLEREFGK